MEWLQLTGTIFETHSDRVGRVRILQEILFSDFGNNLNAIIQLRSLDSNSSCYDDSKRKLKAGLQCFALNELKNRTEVIKHSGLMQIDFDEKDCEGYDLEEMKQAVFSLPFIALVSLSCSAKGFYAIAAIAEPTRQKEYANHIFEVFQHYSITCDRSKGRNFNDLRYVSYDANMLHRDHVEPLHIKQFKTQQQPIKHNTYKQQPNQQQPSKRAVMTCYNNVMAANKGQRWETVQRAAFTMGGIGSIEAWQTIENAINSNPSFAGEHNKYLKCALDCFKAGQKQPISSLTI